MTTERQLDLAIAPTNAAPNSDVGDSGFSPDHWVLGRARRVPGDALEKGGVIGNLTAHSTPAYLERIAMLETARQALTKLHFSRRLREAELGRTRTLPESLGLQVGDLAYFHRDKMKQTRKDRKHRNAKTMMYRQWHGPAMVCGLEGNVIFLTGPVKNW